MSRTQGLEGQMPRNAQALADAQKAAQRIQMQREIGAATQRAPGAAPLGPQAAAQMGTQAARAAAEAQTQAEARKREAVQQQEQMRAQQEAQIKKQELEQMQLERVQKQRQLEIGFAETARSAKGELYDRQMTFQRDEQDRAYLNERQLMDFALAKGIEQEEWLDYQQSAMQAAERELAMMQAAYDRIVQQMNQESFQKRTDISQKVKLELAEKAAAFKREIERKKARAANRGAAWRAGGMLIGAVAGSFTPAGPVAGAAVGGGIGSVVGSQFA